MRGCGSGDGWRDVSSGSPPRHGVNDAVPKTDALDEAEPRIAWILARPGAGTWLKDSLHSATPGERLDPFRLLNDLEILGYLLNPWIRARMDRELWERP